MFSFSNKERSLPESGQDKKHAVPCGMKPLVSWVKDKIWAIDKFTHLHRGGVVHLHHTHPPGTTSRREDVIGTKMLLPAGHRVQKQSMIFHMCK
jgi:hypothetical protein